MLIGPVFLVFLALPGACGGGTSANATDPGQPDVVVADKGQADPGATDSGIIAPGVADDPADSVEQADSAPDVLETVSLDAFETADPGPEATGCAAIDWVTIPGGTYQMGATDVAGGDAQPVHPVTVSGFGMSRTEVTVCQYQSCVTAGTCTAVQGSQSGDDHPVVWVDWNQSSAFCTWAGGRHCTEAEWEYAARNGSAGNLYPWGDTDPTCDGAVFGEPLDGGSCSGVSGPAPACSMPAGNNRWGICDLAGNVWEWVEDDWHDSYTGAPSDGSAWVDSPRDLRRMVRGGCFNSLPEFLRASVRAFDYDAPVFACDSHGIRCCR
jgi:formylglycine-generating enzyme required for sulfatase activity